MQNEPTSPAVKPGTTERYESANPHNSGILGAGVLVLLMLAICTAAVHVTFQHWSETRPTDPARGPIIAPNLQPLDRFPAPHLQVDEHADLMAYLGREQSELTHYAWIDRRRGVVAIPIDRAMDLVAQRESNNPPGTASPPGPSPEQLILERPQWR